MKKVLIIALATLSTTSFAMDAAQIKADALLACNTQLENVPEELQAQTLQTCECNVNNTDYAAVVEAQKSGDTEKVQQDALAVAEACAKEAG